MEAKKTAAAKNGNDTATPRNQPPPDPAAATATATTPTTTAAFAYLYASTETPVREATATHHSLSSGGGGCGIPWRANTLVDLRHCPVSGDPVAMICDGGVVALAEAEAAAAAATAESDTPAGGGYGSNQVVRFRYGKKVYQISTGTTGNTGSETQRDAGTVASPSSSSSWWWWPFQRNRDDAAAAATVAPKLAQDRIAEALDLPGDALKILHKGKQLLCNDDARKPVPTATMTPRERQQERERLSRLLLQISEDDRAAPRKKASSSLLVMGTPRHRALKEPDRPSGGDGTRGGAAAVAAANLVWWPFHFLGCLVGSFFEPFLPVVGWMASSLKPVLPASWWSSPRIANNNSSSSSDRTAPPRDRPHRD